ncbi:hypothetical protein [Nostoc sp. ChiVER01]|uniref:hypothetical protein n=1 Tax=Nostoc sp. ChiVER01 TaxID=3075382 RepID=UPI002AD52164|nr:hypothetical protein [Nostoc sp. ChiVER01]MDZ8225723.1 hypothetical protein [Nostoc sp. ChiVER01]
MIFAKLRSDAADVSFTTDSNRKQIQNPVTGDRMKILRSIHDTNGEYVKFYSES